METQDQIQRLLAGIIKRLEHLEERLSGENPAKNTWLDNDRIDTSAYYGQVGNKIRIEAGDDFAVDNVIVQILDASGAMIEQGPCELNARISRWEFTAAVAVTDLTGVTIIATATDFPGHSSERSITL